MVYEFIRLAALKTFRSAALGRNMLSWLITGLFVFFVLIYVIAASIALGPVLTSLVGSENVIPFLNTFILYFFLFELLYRFFLQKRPTFDLNSYLHLPIKRSSIVHFLLCRSLISPFTVIVLLLFTPFTVNEIIPDYGGFAGFCWLGTLVLISITMHWLVMWYKQSRGNSLLASVLIVAPVIMLYILAYFDWLIVGEYTRLFFDFALQGSWTLAIMIVACILAYRTAFRYMHKNAYLDDVQGESSFRFYDKVPGFLSRFGVAGEIAGVEIKLILRHKKSRGYLLLACLLLFYGLLFYSPDTDVTESGGIAFVVLFIGIFITGAFFLQYGQLLLSWNSANFDFFMTKKHGLECLIHGKWLLFILMSTLFYFLSIPYVWYGYDILLIHSAGFLYNIGIGVHMIMYIALWEPKPMDIGKGAMFNYEGVGLTQFLIGFPYLLLPLLIYYPINAYYNHYTALFFLGLFGLIGLIFNEKLLALSVRKVRRDRYKTSSTFRQEL